jgi:RNA polymerase sigma-70 factor (ECF subfamily)
MHERTIIAQVKAGDAEEFGVLYDAYFKKIYNYLFYRTHDKEITEDLTSATFFKAINGLNGFDERKGNFSAWLYRIARNSLYDHFRANKITSSIDEMEEVSGDSDVEVETIDRELSDKVKKLLETLSSDQREIVTMRIWDDLSYKEIATAMGKSEASCKVAFHRAMTNLKKIAPVAVLLLVLFGGILSRS